MSTVKIFLIFAHAPLLAFAVAGFIEIILGSAFLVFFYIYQTSKNVSPLTSHVSRLKSNISPLTSHVSPLTSHVSLSHSPSPSLSPSLSPITNWRFSFPIAKSLLKDSWPLILSGIAIMIYIRIDQVMLKMMLDDRAVGLYSAAVKLSEIWYFIPMIISQSVFPSILNTKKVSEELYMKRIYNLYSLMIWLAIGIAIALTFFSVDVVKILFGSEYLPDSAKVLSLYVWAGIPVFLGVASSQYLIAENYTKLSFARTIVGAIANVILNLILIPYYGIIGAAIATLISYFIATFFIGLLPDEKLRKQVVMMLSGLLPRKVR
jgi:O-antigen/teichoic acid export membrane protein